ncbi:MAG: putative Zn-dependent protease [Gammaproteobacteria bacterium]|jgi:predicted Zn-dependent protease
MHRIIIALLLCTQLLHQVAVAKDNGPAAWRIRDLASAPLEKVELRGPKNKVFGTVETKQMLLVYSAMTAIMEIAELNAELFVVEGKAPNAFATIGLDEQKNEQNVIGFTFGMLDMIGMDVDAAAAIIGHELAHLKLKHIEERKEAIKNSSTTTFSASSTKYTRDNERESDYLGAIWAVEAGYDPGGAVRVHEKLYKLSKRQVGFSGSHPSSIERITILKSLVRRLSK